MGDFFGNDKIKFLSFRKLNSWTASYGLTDQRLSPVLYKNYTRRRLSVQHAQNLACVASVSVGFRSRERPKNEILIICRARNGNEWKMERGGGGKELWNKKWSRGRGGGGKRNACQQRSLFWKTPFASQRRNQCFWLVRHIVWWLTYSISHIQTWLAFRGRIVEERSRFSSFAKLSKSRTWRQAERSRDPDTLWRKSVDYFAKGLWKKPRFSDGKTWSSLWFARWKTLWGQTFSKSSSRNVKLEKPTASSRFIRKIFISLGCCF